MIRRLLPLAALALVAGLTVPAAAVETSPAEPATVDAATDARIARQAARQAERLAARIAAREAERAARQAEQAARRAELQATRQAEKRAARQAERRAAAGVPTEPEPAGRLVPIKLLATNDLHGQLLPPVPDHGGAAYLAAHLRRVRDAHPGTLYVDAGDATGGTNGLTRRFGDEPTFEALGAMGLDVQALGNHEFDHGTDELLRRYGGGCWLGSCAYRAGTPWTGVSWPALTGNVHLRDTGETLFPGTWTTEVDGVTIGFAGVTAIGEIVAAGNEGLDLRAWDAALDRLVPELRAGGADVVVVIRHLGTNQSGDINGCPNWVGAAANHARASAGSVDVVIDAHTHSAYVCDLEGAPLTTQAFHSALMYTEIDLTFDTTLGEVVERSATNHWVTHDVAPDPQVQAIIDRYLGWR